jgi:hypothetical protein
MGSLPTALADVCAALVHRRFAERQGTQGENKRAVGTNVVSRQITPNLPLVQRRRDGPEKWQLPQPARSTAGLSAAVSTCSEALLQSR